MASKAAKPAKPAMVAIENPWHLFLAVATFVRRILLHSETPGTGKTSAGLALAEARGAESVVITMTDGTTASDLLGHWIPTGNGNVAWHDGPVAYGIRRAVDGHDVVLILNEIDHAGPDASHAFYPLLEEKKANVFTLPSGEVLSVPQNLTIVCTMNPKPEDVLTPAQINRFQVILDLGDKVSPMILDALPEAFRSMVSDGRMAAREAFSILSLVADGCDAYIAIQAVLGRERSADYADSLAIALA